MSNVAPHTAHLRAYPADKLSLLALYSYLRPKFVQSIFWENALDQYSIMGIQPLRSVYCQYKTIFQFDHFLKQLNRTPYTTQDLDDICKQAFQSLDIEDATENVPTPALAWWGYRSINTTQIPAFYYHCFRYNFLLDWKTQRLTVVELVPPSDQPTPATIEYWLQHAHPVANHFYPATDWQSDTDDVTYYNQIKHFYQQCRTGQLYEMRLPRQWQLQYEGDVWNYYRALRQRQTNNFSFFCDFGNFELIAKANSVQMQLDHTAAAAHIEWQRIARSDDFAQDVDLLQQLAKAPSARALHTAQTDAYLNNISALANEAHLEQFARTEFLTHDARLVTHLRAIAPAARHWWDWATATFPAPDQLGNPTSKALELLPQAPCISVGFATLDQQHALLAPASAHWLGIQKQQLYTQSYCTVSKTLNKAHLQHEQDQQAQQRQELLQIATELNQS